MPPCSLRSHTKNARGARFVAEFQSISLDAHSFDYLTKNTSTLGNEAGRARRGRGQLRWQMRGRGYDADAEFTGGSAARSPRPAADSIWERRLVRGEEIVAGYTLSAPARIPICSERDIEQGDAALGLPVEELLRAYRALRSHRCSTKRWHVTLLKRHTYLPLTAILDLDSPPSGKVAVRRGSSCRHSIRGHK